MTVSAKMYKAEGRCARAPLGPGAPPHICSSAVPPRPAPLRILLRLTFENNETNMFVAVTTIATQGFDLFKLNCAHGYTGSSRAKSFRPFQNYGHFKYLKKDKSGTANHILKPITPIESL